MEGKTPQQKKSVKSSKKKNGGKKIIGAACLVLLAVIGGAIVGASRLQVKIQENCYVGPVKIGGLTKEEAAKKVRLWWETEKLVPLNFSWKGEVLKISPLIPSNIGAVVDDVKSVDQAPMATLAGEVGTFIRTIHGSNHFPILLKSIPCDFKKLNSELDAVLPKPHPGSVTWTKEGGLVKVPEIAGYQLNRSHLLESVQEAINGDKSVALSLDSAPVRISDAVLHQINDLIASYTTNFRTSQTSRDTNIRLASSKLNGIVLMPGEVLSFNQTVGERTSKDGFRTAPVFINGKHGEGIGGGICQVSTTLYNASLLSNLKIVSRENHSLPVAYVPLGRDATVDWGEIDLKVKNSYNFPIAIISRYQPGRLSFMVFGTAQPGLKVEIERSKVETFEPHTEYISDASLPLGTEKTIDDGKSGRRIHTFRLVYENGKLVRREPLGESVYKSTPRQVARGTSLKPTSQLSIPRHNPKSVPKPDTGLPENPVPF